MRKWLGETYLFCVTATASVMAMIFTGSVFAIDKTPEYHINIDKEQCLFEILRSPITNYRYPDLLKDTFDSGSYKMLKEMDAFCGCSVKSRREEIVLKKTDRMKWRFRDKKEGLGKEDQCAIANFSDETMDLYFHVIVASRFKRDLEEKLEKRLTQGMRLVASDLSVRDQNVCMESQILRRCTRIKSLRSTFQCIQETTSDPHTMDLISTECPNLIEKNNYKLAGDDLTI